MPYVSFIRDVDLEAVVSDLLKKANDASQASDKLFHRNVIDPFAAVIEMAGFGLTATQWTMAEHNRQAQKSLINEIGLFHQRVLGGVSGWENLGTGQQVDLVNTKKKIIAEIKNKHNTLKGSNQIDLYHQLENLVMMKSSIYKGYTAYYVEIIPKKPARYTEPFAPANKEIGEGGKAAKNARILKIDGASFYALATGHEHALEELFDALPKVIKKCGAKTPSSELLAAKPLFKKAFG